MMLAERFLASERRSKMYRQPPSATTIPLRSLSNGREAFVGSPWLAKAPWDLKDAKIPKV